MEAVGREDRNRERRELAAFKNEVFDEANAEMAEEVVEVLDGIKMSSSFVKKFHAKLRYDKEQEQIQLQKNFFIGAQDNSKTQ